VAGVAYRVTVNEAELRRFLTSPDGPVVMHVREIGQRVVNDARRRAPVDTGRLRASIQLAIQTHGMRITCRIGSNLQYAVWVHEGTGIFGPDHRVIRPLTARVLVFPARGGGSAGRRGLVFTPYVHGQPPQPFLVEALRAACPYPIRLTPP
jgi:hypothetical protein